MSAPRRVTSAYGRESEVFELPTDEAFLRTLLEDIFANYWGEIVFGPIVEGAAFEFVCTEPPRKLSVWDGYLTVDLGGSHFHLCIGDTKGSPQAPTPPAQSAHRKASTARFVRGLDPDGNPVTWGLSLSNGKGEQLCSVFFPNPLLTPTGGIAHTPNWQRLRMWEEMLARYVGVARDPRDRQARRFFHG